MCFERGGGWVEIVATVQLRLLLGGVSAGTASLGWFDLENSEMERSLMSPAAAVGCGAGRGQGRSRAGAGGDQ